MIEKTTTDTRTHLG